MKKWKLTTIDTFKTVKAYDSGGRNSGEFIREFKYRMKTRQKLYGIFCENEDGTICGRFGDSWDSEFVTIGPSSWVEHLMKFYFYKKGRKNLKPHTEKRVWGGVKRVFIIKVNGVQTRNPNIKINIDPYKIANDYRLRYHRVGFEVL